MFRTVADDDGRFVEFKNEKKRIRKERVKLPRKCPRRKAMVLKALS